MADDDLTIHIEGHPGHRGNVLAHALSAKLRKLLSALGQAERRFINKDKRQTDYEVASAGKINPTHLTLHPVPRVRQYDPLPALNWTFEQIEHIAAGEGADSRVDATLAQTLADIAQREREDDYSRLWLTRGRAKVDLDDAFRARSLIIAAERIEKETRAQWFEGFSYGSVVGDLRSVADEEGEHEFVILPPVGPARIQCTFPEDKRAKMGDYLFKTVRVIGMLRYGRTSPFPESVAMDDIELVSATQNPPHLLDLRGLFKGLPRPDAEVGRILDGV